MTEQALPCIACGKELKNVDKTSTNQPYKGLAFTSHGHYGGTLFDPMDGQFLEVNICDQCLAFHAGKGNVLAGQSSRLLRADGAIVGSERVVIPELVPWKPKMPRAIDPLDLDLEDLDNEVFMARCHFNIPVESIRDMLKGE